MKSFSFFLSISTFTFALAVPALSADANCFVEANSHIGLRAESITDEVEITVKCLTAGSTRGLVADIVVELEADVTSKGAENGWGSPLESFLVFEGGPPWHLSGPLTSAPAHGTPFSAAYGNIYPGVLVSTKSVRFAGVPILPAGAPDGFQRKFWFRNLRANAASIAGPIVGISQMGVTVTATEPGTTMPFWISPRNYVDLKTAIYPSVYRAVLTRGTTSSVQVTLMPGSGFGLYAWRPRETETTLSPYFVKPMEDGFKPFLAQEPQQPGIAFSGTRILVRFLGIPAGVTIQAPLQITEGGAFLQAVENPAADGTGSLTRGAGDVNVPVMAGVATMVYEMVSSPPVPHYFALRVNVTASPNASMGDATLAVGLAPLHTAVHASSSVPHVPRFTSVLRTFPGFSVVPGVHTVSGKVTEAGQPAAGVKIDLFGPAIYGTLIASRVTDQTGTYSFAVPDGSYTLQPSLPGKSIYPSFKKFPYIPPHTTGDFEVIPERCVFPSRVPIVMNANGGNIRISVTPTSPSCVWSLQTLPPWIEIKSGSSGVGPGVIDASVKANYGSDRTQALFVNHGGQILDVYQSGFNHTTVQNDFNRDGCPDVVFQDPVSGWVQFWYLQCPFGSSALTVAGSANVTTGNSWRVASARGTGTFTMDRMLTWQDPASGAAQYWQFDHIDTTRVKEAGNLTPYNSWRIVGASDFNRDTRMDYVWQDPVSGASQIWLEGSTITQREVVPLSGANSWRLVGVADMNLDDVPDVIWQDAVSGWAQIWYMGGASGTTVVYAANLVRSNPWRIAAVSDYNRDGRPDLVWQDPMSGASQIWYLHGLNGNELRGADTLSGPNAWKIVGPK